MLLTYNSFESQTSVAIIPIATPCEVNKKCPPIDNYRYWPQSQITTTTTSDDHQSRRGRHKKTEHKYIIAFLLTFFHVKQSTFFKSLVVAAVVIKNLAVTMRVSGGFKQLTTLVLVMMGMNS